MKISELKREHVLLDPWVSVPHPTTGARLYKVYWNNQEVFRPSPLFMAMTATIDARSLFFEGRPVFTDPTNDDWFIILKTGEFDGPYEFEQMLTVALLSGFTHAY